MSIAKTEKRRLRMRDIQDESTETFFVKTHATRILKRPTAILLTHKSSQSLDILTIEIPHTWIPFNLADFVPKEELLKNTQLMNLIGRGILELIRSDDAEEILSEPAAVLEMDRIMSLRMASMNAQSSLLDQDARSGIPEGLDLPKPSMGDVSEEASLVSAPVYDIFRNKDLNDEERAVMLRNLVDIMSDDDKRYIRGQTNNAEILKIVA